MSTSVTGRVVDESGAGITGLAVVVSDESACFPDDLGFIDTDASGTYTVPIGTDAMSDFGTRTLGVTVRTGAYKNPPSGPKVPVGRVLYTQTLADGTDDVLTVADITLRTADVQGWPVSLPGTTNALQVRSGNALRPLPDDQVAWQRVADSIGKAQQSVSVMQLTFDMPRTYDPDAGAEDPEIIVAFPPTYSGSSAATDPSQFLRPERLLLTAASAGQAVKVMLPAVGNWIARAGFWIKQKWNSGPKGDGDAVDYYFAAASTDAKELTFTTHGFSVIHSKAVLVDATGDGTEKTEGILLGSPFEQSYWDTTAHPVYEAQRGSCTGEPVPVHDVSIGVRGPLVADIQQQFLVHWNKQCQPADTVPALNTPAAISDLQTGEYLGSAQLVRTVNVSTLPGLDNGELGVLEAYLRAIEKATDYIYFENQYFTNQAIGDALIAALTDPGRPNLQVILMLNVVPDITFYPAWQTNLVGRIRREAGTDGAKRLGVFTAWSHTGPDQVHHQAKPVIMPNYLHTKTAIVDGKWATIGSANLDGASLDNFQILQPLLGVNRNDELNVVVFNDTDAGFPATGFVDALRLALWSEHLGIPAGDDSLSAAQLGPNHGWLNLWAGCAKAKLQGLITNPTAINPARVLAYPDDAWSGFLASFPFTNNYKNFLKTAKIDGQPPINLSQLTLVTKTTSFSFADGQWADH